MRPVEGLCCGPSSFGSGHRLKNGTRLSKSRAKDDAFKFSTKAAGRPVKLHGFAVARLVDTCGEKDDKDAKDHAGKKGKDPCAGPGESPREITFFATKVVYGKKK